MATFIPKTDTSAIENYGEKLVAQALETCFNKKTIVYHSYPWLRPKKLENSTREPLQPGEIDFVVIHPDFGLLVLEVKGGDIEMRNENKAVLHKGGRTITLQESPFTQVQRNWQKLKILFFEHPYFSPQDGERRLPPFNSGFAVALPTCDYHWDLPTNDGDPRIIIDANGVDQMEASIKRALTAFAGGPVGLTLSETDQKNAKEVMQREFRLLPALWRTVEEQEEQLKRLTNEQYKLLEMLCNQHKAVIEGVAGSGKTMLAMHQVERLSKEAGVRRVLFVCYNRPLADWLNSQLQDELRDKVKITSYHQLCSDWCKEKNIAFNPPPRNNRKEHQDFWNYEAPELLEQAATTMVDESKFDVVIVDEGQDFLQLWWESLEKVFRPDNNDPFYYVFYDSRQNIYVDNPTLPSELGQPFVLPTNCRNTKHIAEHCAAILDAEIPIDSKAPRGAAPIEETVNNLQDAIRVTKKQIGSWITVGRQGGGLRPEQVAILTGPGTDNKQWPDKIGNTPIITDLEKWRAGEGILRCTWRRFKGLEADALVLTQNLRKDLSLADRYVATSRAKHLLTVVSVGDTQITSTQRVNS